MDMVKRPMFRLFPALLISLSLLACSENNAPPDQASDEATLSRIKLEDWPGYYKNQDADGLAAFLHPDFVFITDDGSRSTYQDEVDWVRENPWGGSANDDFVYHIEDIQFTSHDTAIIYGEGTSTRTTNDGQPCAHSYWSSNTLRRVEGRWRPTFSHVSGVKCDPLNPDPQAMNATRLMGNWDVSLYFDPDSPPSTTTMEITQVNADGTLAGRFYQSPFEMGRYTQKDGEIILTVVTSDGSGPYATSGRLQSDGSIKGQTLSTGREFLMPWTAQKTTPDP